MLSTFVCSRINSRVIGMNFVKRENIIAERCLAIRKDIHVYKVF